MPPIWRVYVRKRVCTLREQDLLEDAKPFLSPSQALTTRFARFETFIVRPDIQGSEDPDK